MQNLLDMVCNRIRMSAVNPKLDNHQPPLPQDWHKAEIRCALEKRGYSYAKLSRLNGYCDTAVQMVVHIPWPKVERIVADAIGVTPQEIWPSRYHEDGRPKSGRNERGIGRFKRKASRPASNHSIAGRPRNVKRGPEV